MMAPAATPKPIIDRLNLELVRIMSSDRMKQWLAVQGANPLWSTPDECGAFIKKEIDRWAAVAKASGARIN